MPHILIGLLLAAAPPAATAGRGLWIADIALCRDTVASVHVQGEGPEPVLHIDLQTEPARNLARLTTGRAGKKLPIRLNGRIVSAPLIREPLLAGRIALSGARLPLAPIAEAALKPC